MPRKASKSSSRAASSSKSPKGGRASSKPKATTKTATTPRTASQKAKLAERIQTEARVSASVTAGDSKNVFKWTPENDQFDGTHEFGGPIGAAFVIIISHVLIYYAFTCINSWGGELVYTGHPALKGKPFLTAFWEELSTKAVPSIRGFTTYMAFLILTWVLAVIMPGPVVLGRKIPSEGGYQHSYKCNAVSAWWALLTLVGGLYYFDIWKLSTVARNYGEYLTSAVIIGNIVSVLVYIAGLAMNRAVRMTGNVVYDFFMGSYLNPKLPLGVDFKMVAELRISWAYLFLITLSHAFVMYEDHGHITNGMWLLMLGHFLYCNACQKGEECVPACWDVYYEKFGWMLIFWNLAGVPVFYGVQALFIIKVRPTSELSTPVFWILAVILCLAYYIFDLANGQKNRFRMQRDGIPESIINRKTFPYFPGGILTNPKTIKGPGGREILVDGVVGKARKIAYTADSIQAWIWGASCGFAGYFLPFLYWTFHFFMLIHRTTRDEHVMAQKYGKLWEEYTKLVPYRFIPGVI